MARLRITPLDGDSPTLRDDCTTLLVNAFANPKRYSAERIRAALSGCDALYYRQFFVATEGGVLLAVGGIKAADWAANTHILYLSAVVAERRGEGIGRQLLQARLDWITGNFKHGRILVSTGKTRRFVEAGFKEVRHSLVDGRRLMIKRF